MITKIETGNVVVILLDDEKLFDIEFSYAVDYAQRNRAMAVIDSMLEAYNVVENFKTETPTETPNDYHEYWDYHP